eukprot:COSAG01_NODE_52_length_31456_cov_125.226648_7_plen_200_part_00
MKPFLELDTMFSNKLFITSIFEGFSTKFKCAVLIGLTLATPFIFYQFLSFIFPGLKKSEQRFLLFLLLPAFLLSFFAVYMMYFKILPYSFPFLLSINFVPENIGVLLNFKESIFYILQFLFLAMLLFQFPLVLLLLLYFRCFNLKQLFKSTRFVVLFVFVLSAFLTPPDIVSQLSLALPLLLMLLFVFPIAYIFKIGRV